MKSAHYSWAQLDAACRERMPAEELRRMEAHVRACLDCTQAMDLLVEEERALKEALRPAPEQGEEVEKVVATALDRFRISGVKPRWRAREALVPVAAAAILFVVLIVGLVQAPPPAPVPAQRDPLAEALKGLESPATAAAAGRKLVKMGRKAIPALGQAKREASDEIAQELAMIEKVVKAAHPRVLFVHGSTSGENLALRSLLIHEVSILVHRFQRKPVVAEVSAWAAKWPDTAPSRFHRPLSSVPSTLEELAEYDVLILGNTELEAAPEVLERFVKVLGGSIIFLTPRPGLAGGIPAACADLLPVEVLPEEMAPRERVLLTEAGSVHSALDIDTDGLSRNDFFRKWMPLVAYQPVRARKGAEVLLETEETKTPVLAIHRIGRGQVAYLGTDELCRSSRGTGSETVHFPIYRALLNELANR